MNTGTAPYTYTMFDGTTTISNGTNNVFEVIDDGTTQTLVLTTRDNNGCEITDTVVINPPSDLTFTFNVNPITCDVTGTGVNPGSIDITIDQGPGNYDVEILPLGSEPVQNSGGSDTVNWAISIPGNYIFAVTDIGNGGCTYLTQVVNVPEYNTIEAVIAEVRPVTCFNGSDGEISIQINNYTGQYNYEVFSRDNFGVETSTGVVGSFDTAVQNPGIITGLPAGNLVVHVEALDTPFCDTVSNVATVRQPDRALTVALQQTAEVTCAVSLVLGEVFATGDGGWGGYEFQVIAPDGVRPLFRTGRVQIIILPDFLLVSIQLILGIQRVVLLQTQLIWLVAGANLCRYTGKQSALQCNNDNDGEIEAFNMRVEVRDLVITCIQLNQTFRRNQ